MDVDPKRDIEKGSASTNYCFAMTGTTWSLLRQYFPDEILKLVAHGVVFARMSSTQKQQLVLELQSLGYYVGKLQTEMFRNCATQKQMAQFLGA